MSPVALIQNCATLLTEKELFELRDFISEIDLSVPSIRSIARDHHKEVSYARNRIEIRIQEDNCHAAFVIPVELDSTRHQLEDVLAHVPAHA